MGNKVVSGDIWSRLSGLVPHLLRPACVLYLWSAMWKRPSIFYVTETKERKGKQPNCQFHFSQQNLRSQCLSNTWLSKSVPTHQAGGRWGDGVKVRHEPQNPVSIPALHLPLGQGQTLSLAFLSTCPAEASFWFCPWLGGCRVTQQASASSSVKKWLHGAAVGSKEDSEVNVTVSAQWLH